MHDLPHHYRVEAVSGPEGEVSLSGDGLNTLSTAPPVEFGGPGDKWSPETLLVAAVADCFILSFRAVSRASRLTWTSLECAVEGTLERDDGMLKFTDFLVHATLSAPDDVDEEKAHRILQKAEKYCLITNSLSATTRLEAVVLKAAQS